MARTKKPSTSVSNLVSASNAFWQAKQQWMASGLAGNMNPGVKTTGREKAELVLSLVEKSKTENVSNHISPDEIWDFVSRICR